MIITEEQKEVIRNVLKNISNKQFICIGGLAGTGKSTIIKLLKYKLDNFAVGAYTGKATNVLRKKNIKDARTIHNLIYYPVKEEDETIWLKVSTQEFSYSGFIIDEASMVSKEIHEDLISFNKPIIYIGDHGQLEPIGTKFNLMSNPDYRLETIHRNAGEIAHFADHLRKGNCASKFPSGKKIKVIKKNQISDNDLPKADQIICAFNKTRVSLNNKIRSNLGYEGILCEKEKIICLRNNRKLQLFNGMQGVVTEIHKNKISFLSNDTLYFRLLCDYNQFGKEKNEFEFMDEKNPFDYAYAITTHKSQGDSFGSVVVFEEKCDKWDHKKWSYTAASRARNLLIWCKSEKYIPGYLS